jgi:hypothetical protein
MFLKDQRNRKILMLDCIFRERAIPFVYGRKEQPRADMSTRMFIAIKLLLPCILCFPASIQKFLSRYYGNTSSTYRTSKLRQHVDTRTLGDMF